MSHSARATAMADWSAADYAEIFAQTERLTEATLVENVLGLLRAMKGPMLGYPIDRYDHSLQSATRALRDGADEEMVVCALLHDIGDTIAPENHSQVAAAILRPYVSEASYWIVLHHGLFQGYYYYDKIGKDPNARDRFRDHPHYEACVHFCRNWDQCAFDPAYENLPLIHFEPMVRRVFARKPTNFD